MPDRRECEEAKDRSKDSVAKEIAINPETILPATRGEHSSELGRQPILTRADSDERVIDLWVMRQRSRRGVSSYRRLASLFLTGIDGGIRAVKMDDVVDFLTSLEGKSAATKATYLATIKSLLTFAHEIGYTTFNVGRVVKLPQRERSRAERVMSEADVTRLLDAARKYLPHKHWMLMRLMYYAGLRVSEAVNIRKKDVSISASGRAWVSVIGKGGKARSVLLPERLSSDLSKFADDAEDEDFIFRGNGKNTAIHENTVGWAIKKAAARAGLPAGVSPHWLRHAHASHALDRGAPISLVKTTLGHASVATTSQYLHAQPNDSSGLYLPDVE